MNIFFIMLSLSQFWSSMFDYGFWGFIGSATCIACFAGAYGLLKSDAGSSAKFFGFILLAALCYGGMCLIDYGKESTLQNKYADDYDDDSDDYYYDDEYSGSSNPSFKGNNHEGKKCSIRYNSGAYCTCSGCYGGNWDPQTCQRCGHPVDKHNGH